MKISLFKQRPVPNVATLLQQAKHGKADFQSVAEQMQHNYIVQEEHIKTHQRQIF